MGPRFTVSSEGPLMRQIEPLTPGLVVLRLTHYTTAFCHLIHSLYYHIDMQEQHVQ